MRRLIIMEGDVEEGSAPLKDLFDQVSQGQTKVNFAQVKVLLPWYFCSISNTIPMSLPSADKPKACLHSVMPYLKAFTYF